VGREGILVQLNTIKSVRFVGWNWKVAADWP
jgi:hypothetical protein